jgi:hypothetical protein
LHEHLLDFYRVCLVGESEADAEASDMSVDDDAFIEMKCVAKHYVCGFAPDTGESRKLIHRRRHVSTVTLGHSG